MGKLETDLKKLKQSTLKKQVDARMREFSKMRKSNEKTLFKEMCFCIMTANYNAERAIAIQQAVGDGFITLPPSRLAQKLKILGYRYPNTRAKYITEARKHIRKIKDVLKTLDKEERRQWIVKNVKGLGMKEASHFLRNIGYTDYAIIDFHIIDVLVQYGLLKKPKTLNKERYLMVEQILREIGAKTKMNLSELDLYMWYTETGKILK